MLDQAGLSGVSTHSRPKAAGFSPVSSRKNCGVSTHSRPKAAGGRTSQSVLVPKVSTHSRPKAAGIGFLIGSPVLWFQHTAARRRLVGRQQGQTRPRRVSTHSRPKAAGQKCQSYPCRMTCFNTQPPEGGWAIHPICHRA